MTHANRAMDIRSPARDRKILWGVLLFWVAITICSCGEDLPGTGEECYGNCDYGLDCVGYDPSPECGHGCAWFPGPDPGTCYDLGREGEACPCKGGLACNYAEDTPRCAEEGIRGANCLGNRCKSGLVCRSNHRCLPPLTEGEACRDNWECADGLLCHESTLPHSCRPPSQEGGPCSRDEECIEGLSCNTGYAQPRCEQLYQRNEGEPCGGPENCAGALDCVEELDPPQCLIWQESGEPCTAQSDCANGLVCNDAFDPPQCRYPGLAGDACAGDGDCNDSYYCEPGHGEPHCHAR